jgi:hypothetical protein
MQKSAAFVSTFWVVIALGFIALTTCFAAAAETTLIVSTSKGVYNTSLERMWYDNPLDSHSTLAAFKTLKIDNNHLVTAWGRGRHTSPKARKGRVELINTIKPGEKTLLFQNNGLRIRDMQNYRNYLIAVGHDNADMHVYDFHTKKHIMFHLSGYDNGIAHALKLGDLDNDGIVECYVTYTTKNVTGGLGQEGSIVRVDIDWKTLKHKQQIVIDLYKDYASHAKEIAIFDWDNDNVDELIVEVAPQVEVYDAGKYEFAEPMQFIAIDKTGNRYSTHTLAQANVRLGRELTIADIDQDGKQEIVFADYYETGIYVLEAKSDGSTAAGDNVNLSDTPWRLTKISLNEDSGTESMFPALRSNQVVYDPKSRLLIAAASSSPRNESSKNMALHYFTIEKSAKQFWLQPLYVKQLPTNGDIWHILIE